MQDKRGLLIVVSGPSGAGKGTILAHTIESYPTLKYSISVTTRKPRKGEIEGVNYYFKTLEEFETMLNQNEFLEYQKVYDNYYGTPFNKVNEQLNQGFDVVLEIDVKGALEVKNKYPDAVMIFISPAKRETIEERLRGRSTESEEQLKIRTNSAIEEIKQAVFYDYIVVNEDVHQGAMDIIAIIEAEKCKVKNNKKFIDNLIYGGK